MSGSDGLPGAEAIGRERGAPDTIAPDTIAFVPPRFGPGVIGGAEAVLAEAAAGLAARGHNVEILTTCAKDHFTWANDFPEGVFSVDAAAVIGDAMRAGATTGPGNGPLDTAADAIDLTEGGPTLTVRRFAVEMDTPGITRDRVGNRILAGDRISIQDQQLWMNDSLRCSGLWDHVFDNGQRYRALVFAPYMFWTTFAVSQINPERSIIMPCLHDEPPAALDIFASMIEGAHGVWFLTEPERDLGHRLYRVPARNTIVGASVDVPESYAPGEFRLEYEIEGPYVYYGGRREWGKGWDDLVAGYLRYLSTRRGRPAVKLVTSGVGEIEVPPAAQGQLIDVGLLSDRQRDNAMAGAIAYLQPSAMESFSRTVLEALLASTPVIANRASDVVSWHLELSNGGLTYDSEAELVQCLDFVSDEPEAAEALVRDGRAYVTDRYRLPLVIDRMEAALDQWLPTGRRAMASGAAAVVAGGGIES
ncbi:MAG: glycosyltransferase family 4 protein [Actinomycetota bacterium]